MLFSENKKKGRRKKKKKPAQGNWLTRNLFRPFPLLCLTFFVAIGVLAPRIYEKLPHLEAEPKYHLAAENILIVEQPAWVPEHFLKTVLAKQDIPDSVLKPALAQTVSAWFANDPWVKSVLQVTVSYPPAVKVKLEFREPVAVVQTDGRLFPVDAEAVQLPPEDFSPSRLQQYPVILIEEPESSSSWRYPQPGQQWQTRFVQRACQLAFRLKPDWNHFDFCAIRQQSRSLTTAEAETYANDPVFELVSKSGSIIVWGRAPGSTHPGELTVKQKVGRLQEYQKRFQSFALPHGPYEIDITHWTDITRKVLPRTAAKPGKQAH